MVTEIKCSIKTIIIMCFTRYKYTDASDTLLLAPLSDFAILLHIVNYNQDIYELKHRTVQRFGVTKTHHFKMNWILLFSKDALNWSKVQ